MAQYLPQSEIVSIKPEDLEPYTGDNPFLIAQEEVIQEMVEAMIREEDAIFLEDLKLINRKYTKLFNKRKKQRRARCK